MQNVGGKEALHFKEGRQTICLKSVDKMQVEEIENCGGRPEKVTGGENTKRGQKVPERSGNEMIKKKEYSMTSQGSTDRRGA